MDYPVKSLKSKYPDILVEALLPLVFSICYNELANLDGSGLTNDVRLEMVKANTKTLEDSLKLLNIEETISDIFALKHAPSPDCLNGICLNCLKKSEYNDIAMVCAKEMIKEINFFSPLANDQMTLIMVRSIDDQTVQVQPVDYLFTE